METRDQLLDAAEQLFAERGYAATSLRAITNLARANLAAVNYHFQSKENLLCSVVRRRIVPINRRRLAKLDAAESQAGGGPVPVDRVLRALIEPVFESADGHAGLGVHFPRLIGRLYSESLACLEELYESEFCEVFSRFVDALANSLPGRPRSDLFWAIQFTMGMLVHVLMTGPRIGLCTAGHCEAESAEALVQRLVRFAEGGLTAGDETERLVAPCEYSVAGTGDACQSR